MSKTLVKIENMYAGYNGTVVLKAVDLQIFEQDFLGIIGPNGGGKTTLIKTVLGLLKPLSGRIIFENDLLKNRIGYMPQTHQIDRKFPVSVSEVVESGLISEKKLSHQARKAKTREMIRQMDIENAADKAIGELSGGQLQRTLLARAVINDPELLILDEPNSYVDKRFEARFYELLKEINQKTAIVLVSHDIGTVISTVKNIACVNETLHYHPGTDVDSNWLEEHWACPLEVIVHGDLPHRVLKKH
ncbi:MAG: ABC transporter ATP-binding protein [Candidatus Azobacteroides sp.]|nr:ABC transporter ATP-binding protein [Candidatus Azobacteroides sp.]